MDPLVTDFCVELVVLSTLRAGTVDSLRRHATTSSSPPEAHCPSPMAARPPSPRHPGCTSVLLLYANLMVDSDAPMAMREDIPGTYMPPVTRRKASALRVLSLSSMMRRWDW